MGIDENIHLGDEEPWRWVLGDGKGKVSGVVVGGLGY
jgi:hypothetical protein